MDGCEWQIHEFYEGTCKVYKKNEIYWKLKVKSSMEMCVRTHTFFEECIQIQRKYNELKCKNKNWSKWKLNWVKTRTQRTTEKRF